VNAISLKEVMMARGNLMHMKLHKNSHKLESSQEMMYILLVEIHCFLPEGVGALALSRLFHR
jgi:hypothetical protein